MLRTVEVILVFLSEIIGPIIVVSLLAMGISLLYKGVIKYEFIKVINPIDVIIKYRDYTKHTYGHMGFWLYVLAATGLISVVIVIGYIGIFVIRTLVK